MKPTISINAANRRFIYLPPGCVPMIRSVILMVSESWCVGCCVPVVALLSDDYQYEWQQLMRTFSPINAYFQRKCLSPILHGSVCVYRSKKVPLIVCVCVCMCMCTCAHVYYVRTYVTGPAKIDHLSAKIADFCRLLYHNLITIYIIAIKSLLPLQTLLGFLLKLMEIKYCILNGRY